MFALADFAQPFPETPADPIERELEEIEHVRAHALQNRDILYCSPIARHLVEMEIPRLIQIIRRFQRAQRGSVTLASDDWVQSLLLQLRGEVSIVRDLIERR